MQRKLFAQHLVIDHTFGKSCNQKNAVILV